MSSHLQWLILRNRSSFLVKKRNIRKPFSKEPFNLTNLQSYKYNGFVHRRAVAIECPPDKKGFTLVMKRTKAPNKPAISNVKVTFRTGPRRSLSTLRRYMNKNRYRRDLIKAALRRASAVLMSQRRTGVPTKKTRAKKAE